jgi:flagellar hook-length control protein FliK
MSNKASAELNLEGLAKLIQGESTAKGKDSNLNFIGTESFLNMELETNSGEKLVNLNNNSELKQNLPVKDQFVQKFRGEYSAAKNEMNLELKPDSLGKIAVKLNLDQGKIDAKMIVESKFVQSQLENSMQEIKTDLLKQGINIEQFKIETAKNAPKQVEQQNNFDFNEQNSDFSDGETGQNQEYEQRQFFQGQYYVQRNITNDNLNSDELIMRQQEIINRAAFAKGKLNLIV